MLIYKKVSLQQLNAKQQQVNANVQNTANLQQNNSTLTKPICKNTTLTYHKQR